MSLVFSESNVKKNYFRVFLKTAENKRKHPNSVNDGNPALKLKFDNDMNGLFAGADNTAELGGVAGVPGNATGMFRRLYANYYEQVGSCEAEPKVGTSDVEGQKNNIGTTLGASKEVTADFALNDLDGSVVNANKGENNYNALVDCDGTTVDIILFDEKSGVFRIVENVSMSVNVNAIGSGFENVPVTCKREAAKIKDVTNRYKLSLTDNDNVLTVGKIGTVEIYDAGYGYANTDTARVQTAIVPFDSTGAGAVFSTPNVGVGGIVESVTVTSPGTGYRVGDLVVMAVSSSAGTGKKPAIVRVLTVTA